MTTCCIALGGNLGETETTFQRALEELSRRDVDILKVSSTIESAPMGANAGDVFSNAAATVSTAMSATEFLATLHQVENELGRTRSVHWGPRALDLDLIFYDELIVDSETLVVPHPSLWYRHFVLEPLCEIAPEWQHPVFGETVRVLHARLSCRPLEVEVVLPDDIIIDQLSAKLPPGHCLRFVEVRDDPQRPVEHFARFLESSTEPRCQPVLETERIVRIVASESPEERPGQWAQAMRDFYSAAIG